MPNDFSRRTFFAGAATAAGALRVAAASDRVRLGLIGCGGRGKHLVHMAKLAGGAEFVAVADAWDQRMSEGEKAIEAPVQRYKDYRALLDRKDIDAVIVATTDHHHAHISVDACRAGKDVYVEKPMTSLPMQGHGMVAAVQHYNRILQVGVQQRSTEPFLAAKKAYVDTGRLGKVHMVRTVWNANGGYLEKPPAGMETKPADLDWDMWLGWLPKIPWDPKRYFNRFSYWDISTGGQTGGLFVHMVDVAHWYLNLTRPLSAVALGGIYEYDDGRDTPDNINFILDYPGGLNITFEATITDLLPPESADIVFYGEGGRLNIFRGHCRFLPAGGGPAETQPSGPEQTHMGNFLACVKSRQTPNANVVDGHYGSMACHIGNIAYKEGRRIEWDPRWDV
ncbi:MAG: Gfo/Idh/MocA family protein [Bryobacteraceae bacterium]